MVVWAVILALVGAGANALGTIFQKLSASDPDPKQLFSRKFIKAMVTHRLWLFGIVFDFLGFLLQAAALYIGSLVVVEPILTIDLVMIFLIAHYHFKARAGRSGWIGALLASAGLAAFLLALNPSGGHNSANGWHFDLAIILVAAVVLISAILMKKLESDKARVVIGAVATGLNFSLSAIFTKLAMGDLSHGYVTMLSGWPLYAMIISAASALVIMQSTYASGSLKISQPIITVVGPVCSVLFGLLLFDTSVHSGAVAILIDSISVAAIVFGIILLTNSRSVSGFVGNEKL